ncbi:MAG: hypothetical protein WC906_00310 [Parcubacteria group bacterium]|jgi:hypothetical protein
MDLIKKAKKIIFHPLFIAEIVILSLHAFNITKYDFIADKDSYGWILKYSNAQPDSLYFYRQLFSSLISSLHYLTDLDMYGLFKYIFPIFSMTALFPLWLVARKLTEKKFQTLVLLSAAVSPTVIIQFEGTRPQVMAMLYLYFMLGLSAMASSKRNYNWLYGFFIPITAVSSLFHKIFVLFLALWVIAAAYTYRKIIFRNKLRIVIVFLLLYPWLDKLQIKSMTFSISRAILEIFHKIFLQFSINLRFPAHYINVDGNQMGWVSLLGVLKFYAFYAGPFLGILILLCLYLFFVSKNKRAFFENNLSNVYFLPIYLFIAFFLFIAEFLPRFGNIAYLPDRAWIFLGIMLAFLLFELLYMVEKNSSPFKKNIIFVTFIFGFLISAFGATYVNNSFKYIVPRYEMDSFEWIKNNLEPNRVIFYYGWRSVLQYHSNTPVINIKKDLLSQRDLSSLVKIINLKETVSVSDDDLKKEILDIGLNFTKLQDMFENNFDRMKLLDSVKQMRSKSGKLLSDLSVNPNLSNKNTAYIYYAKNDEKNPYLERIGTSGYSESIPLDSFSVLDDNPKYFQKVYDTSNVKIWKCMVNGN